MHATHAANAVGMQETLSLVLWLEARGWSMDTAGHWHHRRLAPDMGLTQSEAYGRELTAAQATTD
jgi:hypothetical protein